MEVHFTPEQEGRLAQLAATAGTNAEDFVKDAALRLLEEAEWLQAHRPMIDEKIGRGLAQLDRGEGISGDAARARLQERKAAWRRDNPLAAP